VVVLRVAILREHFLLPASEVNANIDQEKKDSESEIIQLVGAKQMQKHSCLKCKLEVKKESILLVCNLIYPTNEPERDEWSFCDILARSLRSQQTTPAWCEECKKFSPTQQTRILQVSRETGKA
jgi:PAB-dependent poly(A)-specific ribonuclease subunit 2